MSHFLQQGRHVHYCWQLGKAPTSGGDRGSPGQAVALAARHAHGAGCVPQMIFAARKDGRRQHFRRQHDKKVAVLALVAVMTAPADALPQELQAAMGQFTAGCLKLLTDLKKQQAGPSVGGFQTAERVVPLHPGSCARHRPATSGHAPHKGSPPA